MVGTGCSVMNGAALTVSATGLDVTPGEQEPLMTTSYVPEWDGCAFAIIRVDPAAPPMLMPLRRHWYVRLLPAAVTVNVALPPVQTVCATGCVVIDGAACTVSVAIALVTGGAHVPEITTS